MARIGLLGGSFNPAHRGHRRISLAALDALGLDQVWWLVSPGNPLKEGATDMAPFAARLVSARKMAARAPIQVSDFEARAGTRYTIDTLAALKRRYPDDEFIWLIGSDIVPNFHQWRRWRDIARTVPIAVIRRPGYDHAAQAARAMGWLRRFVRPSSQAKQWTGRSAPAIYLLRLPPDQTSATRIRAIDPNWHTKALTRQAGPRRNGLPDKPRRKLARSSH